MSTNETAGGLAGLLTAKFPTPPRAPTVTAEELAQIETEAAERTRALLARTAPMATPEPMPQPAPEPATVVELTPRILRAACEANPDRPPHLVLADLLELQSRLERKQ